MSTRLVIFDRDKTLIEDNGYTFKVSDLKWRPGVIELLRYLSIMQVDLAVATNQSGIGRNYFTTSQVNEFHLEMSSYLSRIGIPEMTFFVCPHDPTKTNCQCRKPKPGLLIEAMNYYGVRCDETIFVGDKLTDAQAASSAKVDFVWVSDSPQWSNELLRMLK